MRRIAAVALLVLITAGCSSEQRYTSEDLERARQQGRQEAALELVLRQVEALRTIGADDEPPDPEEVQRYIRTDEGFEQLFRAFWENHPVAHFEMCVNYSDITASDELVQPFAESFDGAFDFERFKELVLVECEKR